MPVQPNPIKLVCPKCGFTKIVKPKSDVELGELFCICEKCNLLMIAEFTNEWKK